MAEVKGVVLRGVLRDVKENHPGGIPPFLDRLSEDVRQAHFGSAVLHGRWYPYEVFGTLLEVFSERVGRGNRQSTVDLGSRSAERDLGTILKAYAFMTSPHKVGDHSRTVWSQRFRDAGEITVVDKTDNGFRLELTSFPTVHPLHCHFLIGYGIGAGHRWKSSFEVTHDRCVHRGDPLCAFSARW
jgi:hypothetical protein